MHIRSALVIEFIGTFELICIGVGAVVALGPSNFAPIALAQGFVIMEFAYAFGKETTSYLNPALTLGALIAGGGRFAVAAAVFLAQFVGGICGGVALAGVYGVHAAHSLGMTTVDLSVTSLLRCLWLVVISALSLRTVVVSTALRGVASNLAPLAVGMTVAFCIMSFGPAIGAAFSPARTLGPAIGEGKMTG
jgi:glycerol uptake facilitator-like aquaporin